MLGLARARAADGDRDRLAGERVDGAVGGVRAEPVLGHVERRHGRVGGHEHLEGLHVAVVGLARLVHLAADVDDERQPVVALRRERARLENAGGGLEPVEAADAVLADEGPVEPELGREGAGRLGAHVGDLVRGLHRLVDREAAFRCPSRRDTSTLGPQPSNRVHPVMDP